MSLNLTRAEWIDAAMNPELDEFSEDEMPLRKSPEPPMPDDLRKITSVDELHTMEQMTQHTIAELMKLQHEHEIEIDQLVTRKRFISRRIVELLAVEFDKMKEKPGAKL